MTTTVLRWTARATGLLVVGLILLFAFDSHSAPSAIETVGIVVYPGLVCLGFLLGWWREILGAVLPTAGLIGIYVWSLAAVGHLPRGPWFVVFWSPALLFLATWLATRSSRPRAPVTTA